MVREAVGGLGAALAVGLAMFLSGAGWPVTIGGAIVGAIAWWVRDR